ncbi:MAG: hypothetical protein SPJ13_04145 [Bacteroidales bacterium]|nr:hypothetical protein [Bacteroidales bacterium]
MRKKIRLMLVASIITLSSCQKDKVFTTEDFQKNANENPFALVGKAHNDFLMDLGNEFQSVLNNEKQLDSVEAETLIGDFLKYSENKLEGYALPNNESFDGFFNEAYITYCNYFEELEEDEVMESLLEESTDMESLLTNVRNKEADIISNMKTHEDSVSLLSLTIFENSLMFWDDAYTNSKNPWHNIMQSMQEQFDSKGSLSLLIKISKWYKAHKKQLQNAAVSGGVFDYLAAEAIVKYFPAVLSQPWILATVLGLSSAVGVIAGWFGA